MKASLAPELRKARRVTGKTLVFRDASPADAKFIHALRTDQHISKHLSSIDPELARQVAWLNNYKNNNDQVYFIIENREGETLGTVRLYDARGHSFCWGSWILKEGAPTNAAIESALMVYAYAIDNLGFQESHFDVRKGNESVWRFHERFGAARTGETDQDYLYQIRFEQIASAQQRYKKFLPESVKVEHSTNH